MGIRLKILILSDSIQKAKDCCSALQLTETSDRTAQLVDIEAEDDIFRADKMRTASAAVNPPMTLSQKPVLTVGYLADNDCRLCGQYVISSFPAVAR